VRCEGFGVGDIDVLLPAGADWVSKKGLAGGETSEMWVLIGGDTYRGRGWSSALPWRYEGAPGCGLGKCRESGA
jgi:hypothetical protein